MAAGSLDVVVRFIGDASSLQAEAAKVEGTGGKLKSWAKGIGAAIGTAFAVDQIKDWIGAASDLNETVSKTEQTFGTASKSVMAWSQNSADAFGLSRQEALDAASGFGNMFDQLGVGAKQSADMSTGMVELAADFASFHNADITQVLEAQSAAFRGEYDALQRFLPTMSAATVEQKAMAMTGKTNAKELTAQEKALAVNALMFEGAGKAAGDFARTQDGVANQTRTMNAKWKDTQAALGQALLPVMSELLPILKTMAGFIKDNASWLVPLTAAILAIVAAVKLWSVAQLVLNAALWTSPITWIILGIVALIAVVVLIVKHFDTFKQVAVDAWEWIKGAAEDAFNWIKDNWPLILAILAGPIGIAVKLIVDNWETIKDAVRAAIDFIKGIWDGFIGFLTSIPGRISSALSSVWDVITSPFRTAIDWVKSAFDGISGAFNSAVGAVKGIWNGFARAWNKIEIHIPSVDIPLVGEIGGGTVGLPDLPILDRGGIVSRPTLALLAANNRPEAVVPLDTVNGGNTYNINVTVASGVSPAEVGAAVVDSIRSYERVAGKAWRAS